MEGVEAGIVHCPRHGAQGPAVGDPELKDGNQMENSSPAAVTDFDAEDQGTCYHPLKFGNVVPMHLLGSRGGRG